VFEPSHEHRPPPVNVDEILDRAVWPHVHRRIVVSLGELFSADLRYGVESRGRSLEEMLASGVR
jgi:hypothetical protein